MIRDVITLMRPKHWAKNGFLLLAPAFAQKLGDAATWPLVASAFGSFCLAASGVYLVNDYCDMEQDRSHPEKRNRPIASGRVSPGTALVLSAVLFVGAYLLAWALPMPFWWALTVYLVMNLLYSWALKQVVILDVMIIAAGFVIRAIAGGLAVSVRISHWLVLCTTMLSLFLALIKRRQELVHMGEEANRTRSALSAYNLAFLDQMIAVASSSTVISYSLYTVSAETVGKFGTDGLKWTLPYVLFGIFRYLYVAHVVRGTGDPTQTLFLDRPLLVNVILWALTVAWILRPI